MGILSINLSFDVSLFMAHINHAHKVQFNTKHIQKATWIETAREWEREGEIIITDNNNNINVPGRFLFTRMNRMCVCVFCVFFVNFALLLLRFALTFPFQRNEFDMQNKNAKVRMKEPERERNETKKKQIIMRMEWMCANEAQSTQWALTYILSLTQWPGIWMEASKWNRTKTVLITLFFLVFAFRMCTQSTTNEQEPLNFTSSHVLVCVCVCLFRNFFL